MIRHLHCLHFEFIQIYVTQTARRRRVTVGRKLFARSYLRDGGYTYMWKYVDCASEWRPLCSNTIIKHLRIHGQFFRNYCEIWWSVYQTVCEHIIYIVKRVSKVQMGTVEQKHKLRDHHCADAYYGTCYEQFMQNHLKPNLWFEFDTWFSRTIYK